MTVRSLLPIALFAALPQPAGAQSKLPDALTLAQRADRALQQITLARAESLVKFDFKGASGFSRTFGLVGKKGQFSIEYTNLRTKGAPDSGEIRSDGKSRGYLQKNQTNGGKDVWKPLSQVTPPFIYSGQELVKRMPIEFPRLVFAPLVTGKGSLSEYVRQARKFGYTVSVSERTSMAAGREVKSYRLTVANPKKVQAKEGAQRVDILLDQGVGLPVTFYMAHNHPDGKKSRITWTIAWKRVPMPEAKQFALPAGLK